MENKNKINNDRCYVVYKHTSPNGKCYNGNPLYWMFYDEYLKRGEMNEQISECREAI